MQRRTDDQSTDKRKNRAYRNLTQEGREFRAEWCNMEYGRSTKEHAEDYYSRSLRIIHAKSIEITFLRYRPMDDPRLEDR